MRVITGLARGRKLETLSGDDVRPTTDKVKESIFSIIQFQIEGRKFLDLFAGSGQMGIEALSRGASKAVFVDKSKQAYNVITKNLKNVNLQENAAVFNMDSVSYISQCGIKFDIAFLDPPYGTGLLQQALNKVTSVMNIGGLILCESPYEEEMPQNVGDFHIRKQYKYGKIKVTVYSHNDIDD